MEKNGDQFERNRNEDAVEKEKKCVAGSWVGKRVLGVRKNAKKNTHASAGDRGKGMDTGDTEWEGKTKSAGTNEKRIFRKQKHY